MKLYEYWRSSCSYRLRIALNFKGLDAEQIHINLLENEQFSDEYKAINPQSSVPTLIDEKITVYQSLAALEYLEEAYPTPAILPKALDERAHVRSLALSVVADIQPLNNTRVLNFLTNEMALNQEQKIKWIHKWIETGFASIEKRLGGGKYCHKNAISMADICLIPQVYNALRFECDVSQFPKIMKIYENCNKLESFDKARPERHKFAII